MNHKNANNKKFRSFQRKLTAGIIVKFIVSLTVYMILLLLTLLIGYLICSSFTWYGDELIYRLLQPIRNNIELFVIFMFFAGFVVFFIYYWYKTLGYLQLMIEATENIYNDKEGYISFPPELGELEQQVNQIKVNVRNSQKAAKEAEQRKNDLVVYLAHDLKTPLTSVIGYLTLLRDEEQISESLRRKYLAISLEKAERLEDLINEFFEITRFNITNIHLESSRIDLTRMLEQITFEFQPMLAEKNLRCILHAPPEFQIRIDADKMQRVFDNLMKNAVNYSFEKDAIEITVIPEAEQVRIIFENHGNPIPKEKLERIFEQFYRLDTARTSKSGGAGLGLAIAREIVELHGGKIRAESEEETIRFEVSLPLA